MAVPRYEYSSDIRKYLRSLFAENGAYNKLWSSDPLSSSVVNDPETNNIKFRTTSSSQLIIEAIEYFILESLSTHLEYYFNSAHVDAEKLQTLSREDIPNVLFKNRFLETFSRPMEDRVGFIDEKKESMGVRNSQGHVVISFGPKGILYSQFELVLPKNATVSRLSPEKIEIKTKRFRLQFEVEFHGFNTNLPFEFDSLYMNAENPVAYQVIINISIMFNRLSILSRTGWEYHSWLDSFINSLSNKFSEEAFYQRINWEASGTLARVMRNILSKDSEPLQK